MYSAPNHRAEEELKVPDSASRIHGRPEFCSAQSSASASSCQSAFRSDIFDIESPMTDPPSSPTTPPDEAEDPFNEIFESSVSRPCAKPKKFGLPRQGKQSVPIRETQNTSDSSPRRPRRRPRKIRDPSEVKATDASAEELPSLKKDPPQTPKNNANRRDNVAEGTPISVEPHVPRSPTPRQSPIEEEIETPQFIPYKSRKETNTRSVNTIIYDYLDKKHKMPPKKGQVGYIYLLQSDEHIKIGRTSRDPAVRRVEWERCTITTTEIQDTYENPFRCHGIVEALLLREFIRERKQYRCGPPCGKTHIEWVEVEKEVALRSLNKWRSWIMVQQPFDRDWNLTPYWSWAVRRVKTQMNDVDWEQWTQPGIVDRFLFECDQFEEHYRRGLMQHFKRKDLQFSLVGSIIFLLAWRFSGIFVAALVLIGLLAL